MTITKKFSQFNGPSAIQAGDIVVGLRNDGSGLNNWQFTGVGGGGSGAVTQIITQPGQNYQPGQWLYVDTAGLYQLANASTEVTAEVIGVVIQIVTPMTTFVLQQSGYINGTQAIFSGLITGNVYYLDTAINGNMVNIDVYIDGQVSRPVFVPDTPTSGWVVPYRGILVDGSAGPPTPTPGTDSNIVDVIQNGNGFSVGNWLRISTPTTGPNQVKYVLAQANNLANSQSVGVVTNIINANQFQLQFAGYNTGAVTEDNLHATLTPSTVYYLSSTMPGTITATDPITLGGISKPLFISEQTTGTVTSNSGYILPQRPEGADSPISGPVFLGQLNASNSFSQTNILQGFGQYKIILNSNPLFPGIGGIQAVGPVNAKIGFQLFIGGAWLTANFQSYYTQGVNSIGGPNTATLWGVVINDASEECLVVLPAFAKDVVLHGFYGEIDIADGQVNLSYQAFCATDESVPFTGYTSNGWGLCDALGIATGIRLFFGGGAAITASNGSFFSVYGIPNT